MLTSQLMFKLKRATKLPQIDALLTEFMTHYQIMSFAFTYYLQYPSSKGSIQYDFASPQLRPWHDYYLAHHYEDSDQTLQWSKHALTPLFWQVDEQASQVKTSKERTLRLESQKFGIDRGICFPIHGPADDFSVLVVHQRVGESCLEHIEPYLHEFHSMGYYYYAQLKQLLRSHKSKSEQLALTPRELQCLQLTGENFLAEELAKMINITPRTVHFHIQNALKKLGVKNKYQAVAKLKQIDV